MTIVEFLLERIYEDEVAARECLLPKNLVPYSDERIPPIKPNEWGSLVDNYLGGPMGKHCARHDPTRVLAECAAKRFILTMHETYARVASERTGIAAFGAECGRDVTADVLKPLVAVYKDHPDYDGGWAL
jgi:hypothetical protein